MVASLWLASFALTLSATAPLDATPHASIDNERVKRTVQERSPSFVACYEDALERDPKAHGRVTVKFVIEDTGRVSEAAKVAGTTVKDEQMIGCVIDVFKSLEFSDWDRKTTITYPLNFEPAPEKPPEKEPSEKK